METSCGAAALSSIAIDGHAFYLYVMCEFLQKRLAGFCV